MRRNVPTERLSSEELARVRELSSSMSPSDVAKVLRIDERTVCRAIAGFEVRRDTAAYVRAYLASGTGGRI